MPELIEIEEQLSRLGAEVEWPVTPNLAPAIRQRTMARRQWFESRWAMAAAVAILALAALVAYSPSREAIANWLNLHTRFQTVPHLATPTPLPTGTVGQRLDLGNKTTLPAARVAVKWRLLIPGSLGEPDEVYLQRPPLAPSEGEITLVYTARQGIPNTGETGVAVLITEARGALNSDFFGKTIGPRTTIEPVAVAGHSGYWIAGEPHVFGFVDSSGNVRFETLRLATNTLLLDVGGTVVRIEGNLTRAQALQIAASLA